MSVSPLKLPPEMTLHIFSLLDYKSLKAVRQVCKTWQLFLEERSLWKNFAKIEELSNKEINRNILNWKNFANRVLREGTIADIICFINMKKTSYNVWNMSIKLAGFAPWKMGVGKNHHVFMFMEKFGILTIDDFSASAEHFLKFALTEGIDGEETLAFLLPRIQIYPKKKIIGLTERYFAKNRYDMPYSGYISSYEPLKRVLYSALAKNEIGKVRLICSKVGFNWKFWNSPSSPLVRGKYICPKVETIP